VQAAVAGQVAGKAAELVAGKAAGSVAGKAVGSVAGKAAGLVPAVVVLQLRLQRCSREKETKKKENRIIKRRSVFVL
jgi:hypothetical protein